MIPVSGSKYIIVLSFLVIALLFAGCTQQPGVGTPVPTVTPTPTPTPTIISPAANTTSDLQNMRDQVALIAAGYAQEIDRTALSAAIHEGPNSTSFTAVAGQLKALRLKDSRLVYVYLVEQQNGTVRFLITGHYGMPGDAPFLSPYPDAPAELKKPVTAPIGVGPYTDSWGTFISGYAPVNMSPDTSMILIGVDIRPDQVPGFLKPPVSTAITSDGTAGIFPWIHPPATALEIRDYVDSAASWAEKNNKTAALAAFGNASGPFVTGEVYIYALDYAGIALALPFQPGQVGSNFSPLKDATGKPYTDIEIMLAKTGGGYILYHYPYPTKGNTSRLKISYVRPVDDTYWIGAGIYTSEDRLIDPDLRRFISDAKTYAQANGKIKAVEAFNNQSGPFVRRDLYIFAYDYNGTVLAWPFRPDQIGVNRLNATDPVGTYHVQDIVNTAKSGGGMVDYYSTNPVTNKTDLKISYVTDVDGTWMLGAGRYMEPGPVVLRE